MKPEATLATLATLPRYRSLVTVGDRWICVDKAEASLRPGMDCKDSVSSEEMSRKEGFPPKWIH